MAELDNGKLPDSKWFWILLLLAVFVTVVFWFVNPLGSANHMGGAAPAAQPSDAGNPGGVPLTLPTTAQ